MKAGKKADDERRQALLAEALPHRHLDDLLARFATGEDVRGEVIENIVLAHIASLREQGWGPSTDPERRRRTWCGDLYEGLGRLVEAAIGYGQKRRAAPRPQRACPHCHDWATLALGEVKLHSCGRMLERRLDGVIVEHEGLFDEPGQPVEGPKP